MINRIKDKLLKNLHNVVRIEEKDNNVAISFPIIPTVKRNRKRILSIILPPLLILLSCYASNIPIIIPHCSDESGCGFILNETVDSHEYSNCSKVLYNMQIFTKCGGSYVSNGKISGTEFRDKHYEVHRKTGHFIN